MDSGGGHLLSPQQQRGQTHYYGAPTLTQLSGFVAPSSNPPPASCDYFPVDPHTYGPSFRVQTAGGGGLASSYSSTTTSNPIWPHQNVVPPKIENLETKKQKLIQGGAAADSVRTCTICNVACNSEKVFAFHLAGEKHLSKVRGKQAAPMTKTFSQSSSMKVPKFVQPMHCEVCNILCNSQEIFQNHIAGRKHIRNLQRLQTLVPAIDHATMDIHAEGAMKGTEGKPESLEVKRRKVIQGGALASAVKVCDLCNVVCNSEVVYNIHITGHKHLSKVNYTNLRARQQQC